MCLFFKRKKDKWPENAKYKKGDYVNFRYRNDLYFGYVYTASISEHGSILYTIQLAGQCPSFIEGYREEDILSLKK